MSLTHRQIHTLTAFAKVRGTRLTYPGEDTQSIRDKPNRKRSRATAATPNHALQRTGAAVTATASTPPPSPTPPRSRRASRAGR